MQERRSLHSRLSTDKHGGNPLQDLAHISIRHVAETINDAGDLLDAASTAISVYRDWQDDMNVANALINTTSSKRDSWQKTMSLIIVKGGYWTIW